MDYGTALEWLYQAQCSGVKLGLSNTKRLLRELGIDTGGAKVCHVAGTNGKGSVCAIIESICRRAGYRTGLYTSPHLVCFRERIRIGFEPASREVLAESLTVVRELTEDWAPQPSFFELTTALALRIFQRAQVEVVILEVGLGGRLDSTNAVQTDLSVITSIGLDHEAILGASLAEIAAEKAGIFKPNTPAVMPSDLPAEARRVMESKAAQCRSPLSVVDIRDLASLPAPGIAGRHQRGNALLAAAAAQMVLPEISDALAEEGISRTNWPGRFHRIERGGVGYVLDGAHNLAACEALVETWKEVFGRAEAALVFGVVMGKDAAGLLNLLRPISRRVILTSTPTPKGVKAGELAAQVGAAGSDLVIPDLGEAIERAGFGHGQVLIAGSLYLVGKALEILGWARGEKFEPSLQ